MSGDAGDRNNRGNRNDRSSHSKLQMRDRILLGGVLFLGLLGAGYMLYLQYLLKTGRM